MGDWAARGEPVKCSSLLFFLMWPIFEVFIGFVTRLLLFYVLVFWPWGMWDLSSQTRDWTLTPYTGRQSLNHWTTREVPPACLRVVWCGPTLFDLLSGNSFKFCFCLTFCICILQPFSKVEDNSCPVNNIFFFYRWRNLRQKRVTCSNQHSNSPREFQKDSVSPEQNDFVEPSVRQLQRWFAKVQCCWNHFDCSRSQSGFR